MKYCLYRYTVAAALIALFLVLSVGVAYARVSQEETTQLSFVQNTATCYLTMGETGFVTILDTQDIANTNWAEKYLPFVVSNVSADVTQVPTEDVNFAVQVYVSASDDETSLALRIETENPDYDPESPEDAPEYLVYEGVAQDIIAGTQTDQTFGTGQIYQFYYSEIVTNQAGEQVVIRHPLEITLSGGQASTFAATLYVTGEIESQLVQLNIIR